MQPGLRSLRQNLKVVDVVLEVADARLPASSRYPDIEKLLDKKERILVLTRADLAEPQATYHWLESMKKRDIHAVAVNARTGEGNRILRQQIINVGKKKKEKLFQKGLRNRPLRVMVLGIPNVGKSSLLNRLAGRSAARTGDRPGITRGKQWVRIEGNMELLDTPGVLWAHWDKPQTALWLGIIGCAPEGVLPVEDMVNLLGEFLLKNATFNLTSRYGIDVEGITVSDLVEFIGRRRGYFTSGGTVDREKAALALINDFRDGYLGRFTLEYPGPGS